MTKKKFDYQKIIGSSKKFREFLEKYDTQPQTQRAYRLHLATFFDELKIDNIDDWVKDTRQMNPKEKIPYLDKKEKELTSYWKKINETATGKTPYVFLSAIKEFLKFNKTFELDDVNSELRKTGHGNRAVTNTQTPTREQLLRIFSFSNPESKAMFLFQIASGQRINEVIKTTFNDIGLKMEKNNGKITFIWKNDLPRIYYHFSKTHTPVKSRLTYEAKHYLEEYLKQRDKFIETRVKRGESMRKKKLDLNKVFPMSIGTANAIWTTMIKNAGLYELDEVTNKPVLGTHSLRRYFSSHFTHKDFSDFFSGHSTPRDKEYRQYTDETLDKIYLENCNDLIIFESKPDLTETHKQMSDMQDQISEKDKQIQDLKDMMDRIRMELLEVKMKQVQELQRKK